MRAFLCLVTALAVAGPAQAGGWDHLQSFPPLADVAVSADGTVLAGWDSWEDSAHRHAIKYARISPAGVVEPEGTAASEPDYGALFSGSVFDRSGSATLVFSFDDETSGVCCYRYEAMWLPRDADAPVRRQRLEPAGGRDRIQFTLAAGRRGERLGAWFVERKPWQPGGRVEVLEASRGGRFGRPRTLARERHLDVLLAPRPVVQEDGTRWVFWSATEDPTGARYTAVRAAWRGPHQQRWRVRTLARAEGPADGRFVNPGGAGFAIASHGNQILLMWRDCDGTSECELRWRWRRGGAWTAEDTLAHGRSLSDWPEFSPAMGERGRASVVFKTCDPGGSGYGRECTLHRADGRHGGFGASTEIGPGTSPVLSSNGRGDAMLVYVLPDDRGHTARAGSLTGPFGAPTRLRPDYQSGMVGFGLDDAGNAILGFTTFDPDVGRVFRYRR